MTDTNSGPPEPSGESNETAEKPDQLALARPVAERTRIVSVTVNELAFKRDPNLETDESSSLSFERGPIKFGIDHEQKHILVMPSFRAVFRGPDDSIIDGFLIHATFLLAYSFDSIEGITDAQIEAFGATTGIFNVWPYWRELVQSSSLRMGTPPMIVPPFLI